MADFHILQGKLEPLTLIILIVFFQVSSHGEDFYHCFATSLGSIIHLGKKTKGTLQIDNIILKTSFKLLWENLIGVHHYPPEKLHHK